MPLQKSPHRPVVARSHVELPIGETTTDNPAHWSGSDELFECFHRVPYLCLRFANMLLWYPPDLPDIQLPARDALLGFHHVPQDIVNSGRVAFAFRFQPGS